MVAVLAAALCFGAIVAALAADAPGGFAVVGAAVAFVCALVVAALLTALVLAVQWLRRSPRRRATPSPTTSTARSTTSPAARIDAISGRV